MNVEICEFYPYIRKEDYLDGSLKINITGLNIEILGIYICCKKNKWTVRLPHKFGIHHDSGKTVCYPLIAFRDKEIHKAFLTEIRRMAIKYIDNQIENGTMRQSNEKLRYAANRKKAGKPAQRKNIQNEKQEQ